MSKSIFFEYNLTISSALVNFDFFKRTQIYHNSNMTKFTFFLYFSSAKKVRNPMVPSKLPYLR